MLKMKAELKEIAMVFATALGLFAMVLGILFMLEPATAGDSLPEPAINVHSTNIAAPSTGTRSKAGASLFARNCAHCHGDDTKGDEGPSLYDLTRSDARLARIIKEGIKGEMPKFASKFSEVDIQSLIAFLRTLKS
jgi:mono/diheme cytochrome c family protein